MMRQGYLFLGVIFSLVFFGSGCGGSAKGTGQKPIFKSVRFEYSEAKGLGEEQGVIRRDPSDIIKVGNLYYVWYTKVTAKDKLYPSGYNGVIYYAVSKDEGHSWEEKGLAIGRGPAGSFDSFGVFTPNVIKAGGKYYLYYTAVAEGFTNKGYSYINKTAIGVAISDSPDGPWKKYAYNPIFVPASDYDKFDSFRIDDVCMLRYGGKYRLYYKGRQMHNTPVHTKMGPAVLYLTQDTSPRCPVSISSPHDRCPKPARHH